METVVNISKAALLARLNERRASVRIVDCYYRVFQNETRLILVMADGSEKIFEGMQAA